MDEFLVAIMSGIALIIYSIVTYFIFHYKWKVYIRWAVCLIIVLLLSGYLIKRRLTKNSWKKMGLDDETYMFYYKYTSLGNRIAFVFTYMLQDFIYEVKKTNKAYNFSKGMFRYDDNLGEYYVDCRMAWYSYYRKNLLKNRLSLHKLRIFSLNKCSSLFLARFPEQKEGYEQVKAAWEASINELPAGKKPKKGDLLQIEGCKDLGKLLKNNLYHSQISRKFIMDNKKRYEQMVEKTEKRKEDIREIKNFKIDLNEKE